MLCIYRSLQTYQLGTSKQILPSSKVENTENMVGILTRSDKNKCFQIYTVVQKKKDHPRFSFMTLEVLNFQKCGFWLACATPAKHVIWHVDSKVLSESLKNSKNVNLTKIQLFRHLHHFRCRSPVVLKNGIQFYAQYVEKFVHEVHKFLSKNKHLLGYDKSWKFTKSVTQ